jgi:putative ABC transport system permease protein
MPWLARLRSFKRNLLQRASAERELADEASSVCELLAEEKMRQGMAPDAARRSARLELGGVEQWKEQVRAVRSGAWLETLGRDVGHGVRILRKNPGFAVVAVLTLALGISANTAIFSVVSAVLLRPLPYPDAQQLVLASPGYFRALGCRLRAGRLFTAQDTPSSQPVAVVNEAFARRWFAGQDPVGKRLVMDAPANLLPPPEPGAVVAPRRTIVGVVADVKNTKMNLSTQPEVFAPVAQNVGEGWASAMALVVRTAVEPAGMLPAIRAQVRAVDPDQPVTDVATMDELLARSLSQPRFGMLLLSLFAGVALLLAAIGVYGVVAYEARQRTHEIGIRMAIGARPAHILRLIVGDGLRLSLLGAALGIAAGLPATRLLASLLYGVGRYDPLTFLAMPAGLVAAAALAAYLPARRALRLDPVTALRHE